MKTRLLLWSVALLPLLATQAVAVDIWPMPKWPTAKPAEVGFDAARLAQARDYALSGGGAGYITCGGRLVMSWGDVTKRFDLKSTTKSIGVTALGLAIGDGKLALNDLARDRHPRFGIPPESNAAPGWLDKITLAHLATQTAGFEKPGGYGKLLFEPGTEWAYSDGGPNWLAECVTLAYRQDIDKLMFDRVFAPLGISRGHLVWRANSYRPREIEGIARREFGAGISANVDAMARIGYLYLREGRWQEKQILPPEFVRQAAAVAPEVAGLPVVNPQDYGKASSHYGLLWWNNADGTLSGVPRDAFWSWGLYDSLIVVIPSLDIVVSRAGASWKRDGGDHYDVLKPFLEPIAAAAKQASEGKRSDATADADLLERKAAASNSPPARKVKKPLAAPYPPSPVIRRIDWAPASTIVRRARGSDNWPLTWGDDDAIYTAYGDGRGFEPFVDAKLSLGLAKISGGPGDVAAVNLRSSTAEQRGDGAAAKKASGLLMVDGVLYLLARNAGNSQLAWSSDRGTTWTWADWKFTRSFGCPTFLNFGRNYDGARDDYVYVYSHDSDSAYEAADRMVLARVLCRSLKQSDAYEFFAGLDAAGQPQWTSDIDGRSAVFKHPGRCYRSSISYNAPLRRYLWCQVLPGEDPRFAGGLGIYDAPEPWGPWTTAYFAGTWDVAPGETAGIPTKWTAGDGLSFYLVFSGEDHFSVRQGRCEASTAESSTAQTSLGINGTQFTINGKPTFLLGISYYGGLGASEDALHRDLDQMQKYGFNWIRVWATWAAFGGDLSAVEPATGEPRQPYLDALEHLVAECDRRGMIVDVTLSRGNGATGPPRLATHEAHCRAVQTIVEALEPRRNWYLDLSNERNIGDSRHTAMDELHKLRELVRRLDAERLVAASHGGDIGRNELRDYLKTAGVDFIAPHRPRNAESPRQTEAKTREYLAVMRELGRIAPVHYQEPFRRGYGAGWQPSADDYLTDLAQARTGGAAGWCFHNGDQRGADDGRPRRSFDLRQQRLFEQLDPVELEAVERISRWQADR